jgi:hypothetical protein
MTSSPHSDPHGGSKPEIKSDDPRRCVWPIQAALSWLGSRLQMRTTGRKPRTSEVLDQELADNLNRLLARPTMKIEAGPKSEMDAAVRLFFWTHDPPPISDVAFDRAAAQAMLDDACAQKHLRVLRLDGGYYVNASYLSDSLMRRAVREGADNLGLYVLAAEVEALDRGEPRRLELSSVIEGDDPIDATALKKRKPRERDTYDRRLLSQSQVEMTLHAYVRYLVGQQRTANQKCAYAWLRQNGFWFDRRGFEAAWKCIAPPDFQKRGRRTNKAAVRVR